MGDDLKPCPFCGVSNTHMATGWLDGRYSEEEWFQVECQWCCAAGPSKPSKYQAAEAWNNAGAAAARAEAAEKRAEAAEARAAQAEADARLMAGLAFASFVARTSFSTEIVDASLLDALEVAGDHAAAVSDADMIAAARRILAAGGAA